MRNIVIYLVTFVVGIGGLYLLSPVAPAPPVVEVAPPPPVEPGPYEIKNQIPKKYLSYTEVIEQMQEWHAAAPEITELGTYGKNNVGDDLTYIRVGTKGKERLIIHSCIHGNERLACAVNMGLIGRILNDYKRNEEVTWLVQNRDIYFVPVFDPESFRDDVRFIQNADPNRNWPYPGRGNDGNDSASILAMQKWMLELKPKAMLDLHTFGRLVMQPSVASEADEAKLDSLAQEMGHLSGYRPVSIGNKRDGYAINYYYWKGNCVSFLIEIGPGPSHAAPISAIQTESDKTYKMFLLFMKKSVEIQVGSR